jgi:hypothetical protein
MRQHKRVRASRETVRNIGKTLSSKREIVIVSSELSIDLLDEAAKVRSITIKLSRVR